MKLRYSPTSPYVRKVMVMAIETGLEDSIEAIATNAWESGPDLVNDNPLSKVPTLVLDGGETLYDSPVICEYLDEIAPDSSLFPGNPAERAEVRRLVSWFDRKFNAEVSENLVGEKIMKRFLKRGAPDASAIRAGKKNLKYHLQQRVLFHHNLQNHLENSLYSYKVYLYQ